MHQNFPGVSMRAILRLAALPVLALTAGLIGAAQPEATATIETAPAFTAQQLLTPPRGGLLFVGHADGRGGHGGGPTLLGKLDAGQIRAVTTTGRNNMPTFREIHDVNQLRDVSEFIVQELGSRPTTRAVCNA